MSNSWQKQHDFVRYVVVGGSGLLLGWFVYNMIYVLIPFDTYRATFAWVIGYLIGVWQQHGMHWLFTFERGVHSYPQSLGRAYLAYSSGLIITPPANFIMVEILHLHHQLVWFILVGSMTLINFVLLRRYAFTQPAERERREKTEAGGESE